MDGSDTKCFQLFGWQVLPSEGRIVRGKKVVHLEPRVMDLLLCLARHPGQVVSHNMLVDQVWRGRVVGDEAIARAISELRKAFGDSAAKHRLIRTIPKRGYELAATAAHRLDRPLVRRRIRSLAAIIGLAVVLTWYPLDFALQSAGVEAQAMAVAILPFANLTGDADLDYLGYGIARELQHTLATFSGVQLLAWQSSLALSEDRRRLQTKNLTIDALVEGAIRGNNRQMSISIRVVSADGAELLTTSVDTAPASLLADYTTLSHRLLTALLPARHTFGELRGLSANHDAKSTAAWMAYLHGSFLLQHPRIANLNSAVRYFARARQISPAFVPALLGEADAHALRAELAADPLAPGKSSDESALAQRLYRRVLLRNPRSVKARIALLKLDPAPGSWSAYEDQLRELYAQDATCVRCVRRLVDFLQMVGKSVAALHICEGRMHRDPLNAALLATAARIAYRTGDFVKGLLYARRTEALAEPGSSDAMRLRLDDKSLRYNQYDFTAWMENALQGYGLSGGDSHAVIQAIKGLTRRDTADVIPVLQANGLLDYWRSRGAPDSCLTSPRQAFCRAIGSPALAKSGS